ncbi:hypothetical protein DPM33_11075 [Mesorhizobium hawassense]|uniref:Uncharacterized protein n=1 Tax=Mesorhizobium hawassense TaxID=1209954 RepID=A0A330I200_9HYPH|nr:hypothetical protein DPM33_11075 [Mesorhizobium hawassense]
MSCASCRRPLTATPPSHPSG